MNKTDVGGQCGEKCITDYPSIVTLRRLVTLRRIPEEPHPEKINFSECEILFVFFCWKGKNIQLFFSFKEETEIDEGGKGDLTRAILYALIPVCDMISHCQVREEIFFRNNSQKKKVFWNEIARLFTYTYDEVEERNGVECQGLPVGLLGVSQES